MKIKPLKWKRELGDWVALSVRFAMLVTKQGCGKYLYKGREYKSLIEAKEAAEEHHHRILMEWLED